MGLYECVVILHLNNFYLGKLSNIHLYFRPAQAHFQFDAMKHRRQAATQSL